MIIELNEEEQFIAQYIAKQRKKHNLEIGVTPPKVGPDDQEYLLNIELDGIGGELAFCKMVNVYPDLTTQPRSGGHDCMYTTYTIDVKTTRHKRGNLIVPAFKINHNLLPDIYALLISDFPTFQYMGWQWAREVITQENLKDLGYGPTYFYEVGKLRKNINHDHL